MRLLMTPEDIAQREYATYILVNAILQREKNPAFKEILMQLRDHEKRHFIFWKSIAQKKDFDVKRTVIARTLLFHRVFGLLLTLKLLEGREESIITQSQHFRKTADPSLHAQLDRIIVEEQQEGILISQVTNEKIHFFSSIVLGINDGLIELTGALIGFATAFGDHRVVGFSGLITGVAASLSMSASAFMQARHEVGKNPRKAAIYTGISYIIVVMLLVAPFFLLATLSRSLVAMGCIALLIVSGVSFYSSLLLRRRFLVQFSEAFLFSIGVATIAFLFGFFVQRIIENYF